MSLKKLLLTSLIFFQAYSSSIEMTVLNSDYNAFTKSLDSFVQIASKEEIQDLIKRSQLVLKQRVEDYKARKFTSKDNLKIGGGVLLNYFILGWVRHFLTCIMVQSAAAQEFKKQNLVEQFNFVNQFSLFPSLVSLFGSVGAIGYGIKTIYNGVTHKDSAEKLKNAAAIKQLLEQLV